MYKAQIYIQYIEIYTAYVLFIFLGVQLEKYLKDSGQGANNEKKMRYRNTTPNVCRKCIRKAKAEIESKGNIQKTRMFPV